MTDRKTIAQCKSCPWRIDRVPDKDIPNYREELHKNLTSTIANPGEVRFGGVRHVMACHYSKPGAEFACAGWIHNQRGVGNNIGVRLALMSGAMPVPEIDGEQHERFEDTLPKKKRKRRS